MTKYFAKIHFKTDEDDQIYITCKSIRMDQDAVIIDGVIINNEEIKGHTRIPLSVIDLLSVTRKEVDDVG